jgi:hypothetical protein
VLFTGAAILAIVIVVAITFAVQSRNDEVISAEIARTGAELQTIGTQIADIKDANLKSMNDYIGAYAQIEPLLKEYDQKLQKFSDLCRLAQERDRHRGLFNVKNLYSQHHPEVWADMAEMVDLVHKINEVAKREESVIRAMSSLPEAERVRFWHEQFTPLAAEEHALRERLLEAGQSRFPDSGTQ